ncbi:MFS general substrate transporter [Ascobolus immersus RN42]|uniref:MFS general substrate transporter n=1 Tax=Ascobolus immersus RN42 TaxID=1160509 RepID=A0A3N4I5L9_ASCIM|nr:MFS general substrate transporter [Ascobolus immersus RN42]
MSAVWAGQSRIWGPNHPTRMALLTICLTGVQLVWGIEMAYASPYLLSLGLSKSMMSLVWIVGPLSGLITQPIVGVMADRSTSRWGRRRPVMVIGSVMTILGLLALGWTKEIVGVILKKDSTGQTVTIIVAVLAMYLLDFSVNAVQACCRALIVDSLPTEDQQLGNAWASRMIAIGNVGGYLAGTIKLKKIFGDFLGDTQFKQLVLICSFALCCCIGATCLAVSERILVERRGEDAKSGIKHVLHTIWVTIWNMPRGIGAVCLIIFFAWIGWFPFMVYGTTFVGEVLKRYDHNYDKKSSIAALITRAVDSSSDDNLGDIARIGSRALVIFSCVSLASSFFLPWLVDAPETDELHQKPLPTNSFLQRLSDTLEPYRPDLATAWIFGHVFFAVLMFATLFTRTVLVATLIVAAAGIPWSLMTWAPFSFVGEEINKLGAEEADRISPNGPPQSHDPLLGTAETRASSNSPRRSERSNSAEGQRYDGSVHSGDTAVDEERGQPEEEEGKSELAGIYLGILNVFTCLPQFVATFISYVIFSFLEPGQSPEFGGGEPESPTGINAIAVVLGIGGISALCAAHYTWAFKCEREA